MRVLLCKPNISEGARQTVIEAVADVVRGTEIDVRRKVLGPEARLGAGTMSVYELVRQGVPFLIHDAEMYPYIETVRSLVASGELARAVAAALAAQGAVS